MAAPATFKWLFLLLLLFPMQPATAQLAIDWIPLNDGLEGDQVDLLWQSPAGTFFAGGAYSGLFRSPAYKAPWEMTSLYNVHAQHIAADGYGTVYVAGDEGLFMSSDEGLTWDSTVLTEPVYSLASLPNGNVFAGTYDGLYRRKPGEQTFTFLRAWIISEFVASRSYDEIEPISLMTTLANGQLAVAAGAYVYLSTNGDTWECLTLDNEDTCWSPKDVNSFGEPVPIQISTLDAFGNTLLIGDKSRYCSKSAYDVAQNKLVSSIPIQGNEFLDSDESNEAFFQIMALCVVQGFGGGLRLFKRLKDAAAPSWETLYEGAYAVESAQDGSWICVGQSNGVHCSENQGLSWEAWNSGLRNTEIEALFVSHDNLLFAGTMHGMYQDLKHNAGWDPIILNDLNGNFGRSCISSPFAFSQSPDSFYLARSGPTFGASNPADMWTYVGESDASSIFEERPEPFNFPFCGSLPRKWLTKSKNTACPTLHRSGLRRDEQFVYRKGGTFVDRSADNLMTYDRLPLPVDRGPVGLFTLPGHALYAFKENRLWQSKDHGDSWTALPFPEVAVEIKDVALTGDATLVVATSAGLYLSTDDGQSWQDPVASDQCFNLIEANAQDMIVSGDKLLYTDYGKSWQTIETPLPGYISAAAFDNEGFVYLGTAGWGVFRSAHPLGSTMPIVNLSKPLETGIFPNPAQSTFKISLELSELAEVHVELYDVLGRYLGQLFNRQLSRGKHYLPFTRTDLAPGIYMVQIKAGDQVKYDTILFR